LRHEKRERQERLKDWIPGHARNDSIKKMEIKKMGEGHEDGKLRECEKEMLFLMPDA